MASSKGKKMARAIMQQPNPGRVPRVALAAYPFEQQESCDQDKSQRRVMRRPNKHSESLAAIWFRVCTMSTLLGPHIAKVARTHLGLIPTLKTRVKQQSFAATWFPDGEPGGSGRIPVPAPCRLSFELTTNNHSTGDLCWQDTVKLKDAQDMIFLEFWCFAHPS